MTDRADHWAVWLTLLLGLLGSTRAVLVLIAIGAAALLMSGCGPTETEAMQDVAADLADAQATALLTAQGRAK